MLFEIQVPEWANWVAQDNDGSWYFYPEMPEFRWNRMDWYAPWSEAQSDFACSGEAPADASTELYPIIWDEE